MDNQRYSRQILFTDIGATGQKKISSSSVLLIGCGALGSVLAELMVRSGVRQLKIVDRDFLELSNLQRQVLFDEEDLAHNLPKAEAAARKLRKINSSVQINPFVADVNHESMEFFLEDTDLILDGTDNLQTRFLVNDAAVKHGIPWIYGACVGARGMTLVILAGGKPCLRCLVESPPEPAQLQTCDTAGIIAPIVNMVAAWQGAEALKILSGNLPAVNRNFTSFDLWRNRFHQMSLQDAGENCPCCRQHNFEYLAGKGSLSTISLCGRNAVQVRPKNFPGKIDLAELAERLQDTTNISLSEFLLRFNAGELEITVFPDARAIIKGTNNIDVARSLYARYIGH